MTKKYCFVAGFLIAWGIGVQTVSAQTPVIDQILRAQQEIELRKQQQLNEQRRQIDERDRRRQQTSALTPLERLQGDQKACVEIKTIELEVAKTVSGSQLKAEVKEFHNRCLSIIDIQNVLRAVTNHYIEQGYITSRALLAPQDLTSGRLKVLVVEGGVGELSILENNNVRRGGRQLFGKRVGNILNIRDLEQGIDQINRLASKDATIRVEPGKQVGGSIVYIDVKTDYKVLLSAGADNDGSTSTGQNQWNTSLIAEDLLGLHESVTISVKKSVDELHRGMFSNSYNGFLSVPFHRATLNLSGSFSQYESELITAAQVFSFSGESYEARAALDWMIYRNQNYIVRVGTGLTLKENRNFIENAFIDTSSQRLTVGEVYAGVSGQFLGGYGQINATLKHGLNGLGAQDDDAQPRGTPSAQFTEFEISGSYRRNWRHEKGDLGLHMSGFFSASPDTLFSSERLSLGEPSTVRGFRDQFLSGDSGGYGRVELNWTPTIINWGDQVKKFIGSPQFYTGIDGGFIDDDASDRFEGGSLSGAALGVRLSAGILTGDIAYVYPLHFDGGAATRPEKGHIRYKAAIKLTF